MKERGFTLIETIVAIAFMTVAITGPIVLAGNSIRASRNAVAELTATHLAEEGLEVFHNIRDNNSADDIDANHTNWDTILTTCGGQCIVDITAHNGAQMWVGGANGAVSPALNADKLQLYQNMNTGVYVQRTNGMNGNPWVPSPYARNCSVTSVVAGKQMRVICTVTYTGYGGVARSVTLTQDLYNWFPHLAN